MWFVVVVRLGNGVAFRRYIRGNSWWRVDFRFIWRVLAVGERFSVRLSDDKVLVAGL